MWICSSADLERILHGASKTKILDMFILYQQDGSKHSKNDPYVVHFIQYFIQLFLVCCVMNIASIRGHYQCFRLRFRLPPLPEISLVLWCLSAFQASTGELGEGGRWCAVPCRHYWWWSLHRKPKQVLQRNLPLRGIQFSGGVLWRLHPLCLWYVCFSSSLSFGFSYPSLPSNAHSPLSHFFLHMPPMCKGLNIYSV